LAGISSLAFRFAGAVCLLSAVVACRPDIFYLPGETGGEWGQTGRSADGRGFLAAGPDPPLRLLWTRKTGDPPVGCPLLAEGLVLQLTTGSKVRVFDRRSGRLLGKRGYDAPACAPPVVVDRRLILSVLGKRPALQAFDRQRREKDWSYRGIFCAPLVARGDTLWAAGEDGQIRALRASDGQVVWQTRVGGRLLVAPALDGGMIYAGDGKGAIVALEAGSGRELWRHELEARVRTRPAADGGRVFAGTAGGRVVALDAVAGSAVWQTDLGVLLTPGMVLGRGILVVGAVDGRVVGLDQESGARLWEFATGGAVRAAPAGTGNTVYCGSSDGYLYALALVAGRLEWKYRLDGPALADVAVDQGVVAVTSDRGTIYVFGKE
jgi:outer membrane protein assembly factor BamB